jgi:hypothetical protein
MYKYAFTEQLAGLSETKKEKEHYVPYGKQWQDERFDEEQGYHFWLNETPVRTFPGCTLPNTVSKWEKGVLLDCAMLMEAGTNMLCRRVDGYYKPLDPKRLSVKIGMSERQTRAFINRMCELRIMAKEDGRIYINPCYFFRGRFLSFHLFSLFETDLRSILPEWVVQRYDGQF